MKRTPLRRRTPLDRSTAGLSRTQSLAPVSRRQRRRNNRYAAARARVLVRDEGRCQRCERVAECVHHLAGRDGDRMWDETLLVALCTACHDHVHANPAESYEDGWMARRTREVRDVR